MTPFSQKPRTSSSTTPCAWSDGPRIRLAGLDFFPDLTGALYAPDYKALLVADLHFEKGSSRAMRGVHLPPYDTRSTLAGLQYALERFQPERLVCLGDSFHDADGPNRLSADDFAAIRALGDRVDVTWLTGNHDPDLPSDLGGTVMHELALGAITLRHIPGTDAGSEIAGHLHPAGVVVRRGRKLRRRCFVADGTRMILPAFGAYTGGLNVVSPAISDLFEGHFWVWMLGRTDIHRFKSKSMLPGRF